MNTTLSYRSSRGTGQPESTKHRNSTVSSPSSDRSQFIPPARQKNKTVCSDSPPYITLHTQILQTLQLIIWASTFLHIISSMGF